MCKDPWDKWRLVGLSSFVLQNCTQAVVARVSSYLDWMSLAIAASW